MKKAIHYNICTCDVCNNYSLLGGALLANHVKEVSRRAIAAEGDEMVTTKVGVMFRKIAVISFSGCVQNVIWKQQ